MICATCAEPVEVGVARCSACGSEPLLVGRYRLDQELASTSAGVSYRATRLDDSLLVRALRRDFDRQVDDHEIRGQQLRLLDQPRLPRCIEICELELGTRRRLWMIHDFVRGTSLAELQQPLDKDELMATLAEAVALLVPLHARWPPLIHGALEHSSLLRRSSDAGLTLVDFDPLTTNPSPTTDMRALADIAGELIEWDDPELARQLRQLLSSVSDATEARNALTALQRLRQTEAAQAVTRRMSSNELALELGIDSDDLDLFDPSAESGEHPVIAGERDEHPRDVVAGEIGQRADASGSSIPVLRRRPPKPRSTPIVPRRQYKQAQPASNDAPVMRPEELSRELSAAHRVAGEMQQRRRFHDNMAKITVIFFVAVVSAVVTLYALGLL